MKHMKSESHVMTSQEHCRSHIVGSKTCFTIPSGTRDHQRPPAHVSICGSTSEASRKQIEEDEIIWRNMEFYLTLALDGVGSPSPWEAGDEWGASYMKPPSPGGQTGGGGGQEWSLMLAWLHGREPSEGSAGFDWRCPDMCGWGCEGAGPGHVKGRGRVIKSWQGWVVVIDAASLHQDQWQSLLEATTYNSTVVFNISCHSCVSITEQLNIR